MDVILGLLCTGFSLYRSTLLFITASGATVLNMLLTAALATAGVADLRRYRSAFKRQQTLVGKGQKNDRRPNRHLSSQATPTPRSWVMATCHWTQTMPLPLAFQATLTLLTYAPFRLPFVEMLTFNLLWLTPCLRFLGLLLLATAVIALAWFASVLLDLARDAVVEDGVSDVRAYRPRLEHHRRVIGKGCSCFECQTLLPPHWYVSGQLVRLEAAVLQVGSGGVMLWALTVVGRMVFGGFGGWFVAVTVIVSAVPGLGRLVGRVVEQVWEGCCRRAGEWFGRDEVLEEELGGEHEDEEQQQQASEEDSEDLDEEQQEDYLLIRHGDL